MKKLLLIIFIWQGMYMFSTPEFSIIEAFALLNTTHENLIVEIEFTDKKTGLYSDTWYLADETAKVKVYNNIKNVKEKFLNPFEGFYFYSIYYSKKEVELLSYKEKLLLGIENIRVKNEYGETIMVLEDLNDEYFKKVPEPSNNVIILINNQNQ